GGLHDGCERLTVGRECKPEILLSDHQWCSLVLDLKAFSVDDRPKISDTGMLASELRIRKEYLGEIGPNDNPLWCVTFHFDFLQQFVPIGVLDGGVDMVPPVPNIEVLDRLRFRSQYLDGFSASIRKAKLPIAIFRWCEECNRVGVWQPPPMSDNRIHSIAR